MCDAAVYLWQAQLSRGYNFSEALRRVVRIKKPSCNFWVKKTPFEAHCENKRKII